jgi:hypothetical protein
MTLEEIARSKPFGRPPAVPAWTFGCWSRRCITYANGQEDADTTVIWIQSHGLTGDLRIPAWRPSTTGKTSFADFTVEDLSLLASVEGGVADTRWADGRMYWDNWSAFQPYDKWPEPGVLQRVGACLIEWAPSGIYVEDWRLQDDSAGLLVGLRLAEENGRPRDGGLIISGAHALVTLGRFEELPLPAPAQRQLVEGADRLFEAEASYCRRAPGGDYRVALSTNPFRHGGPAPILDGFEPAGDGLLRQTGPGFERLWRIDTLLDGVDIPSATPASSDGREWLASEAEVLLHPVAGAGAGALARRVLGAVRVAAGRAIGARAAVRQPALFR